MKETVFRQLEQYMHLCMRDSAHDKEHVYRVLYIALDIASHEQDVNFDVLITACLLHDIGRQAQFDDPTVCHAGRGAEMAHGYLIDAGFDSDFCRHVADCIRSHRFRKNSPPESIEAKILFDADKLDVAGAMGIARTLLYNGEMGEPLYSRAADGSISDGSEDIAPSFFQEYHYKLKKLYTRFYTRRGMELAAERQSHAVQFYADLLRETCAAYDAKLFLSQLLLENN